jgi:hypothetical protein
MLTVAVGAGGSLPDSFFQGLGMHAGLVARILLVVTFLAELGNLQLDD